MRYVKLINNYTIEFAPKSKGSVANYDKNTELLKKDGYKEYVPSSKEADKKYLITYIEDENKVYEQIEEITPDSSIILNKVKQDKIIENDKKRDEALNQGVIYKNILFDSDTDQKVNLLAIVSTISDEDKITWFGKDNQPLECDKQDLINIGSLITQLHSFCWNKNALIKAEINNATSVEEVEAIIIDYK